MGQESERHPCPGLCGGTVLRRTNRPGHTSSGAGVGCWAQAVVPVAEALTDNGAAPTEPMPGRNRARTRP